MVPGPLKTKDFSEALTSQLFKLFDKDSNRFRVRVLACIHEGGGGAVTRRGTFQATEDKVVVSELFISVIEIGAHIKHVSRSVLVSAAFLTCSSLFLRLQTDADKAGVERLAVTQPRPDIGMKPSLDILPGDVNGECSSMLPPLSAAMVKGFTRCMAAWTVILCSKECPQFLEDRWQLLASELGEGHPVIAGRNGQRLCRSFSQALANELIQMSSS